MFQTWQYLSKRKLPDLLKEMNFARAWQTQPRRGVVIFTLPVSGTSAVSSRLFTRGGHRLLLLPLQCPPPTAWASWYHGLHIHLFFKALFGFLLSCEVFAAYIHGHFFLLWELQAWCEHHLTPGWKCRTPAPAPALLNLHFSKLPRDTCAHWSLRRLAGSTLTFSTRDSQWESCYPQVFWKWRGRENMNI